MPVDNVGNVRNAISGSFSSFWWIMKIRCRRTWPSAFLTLLPHFWTHIFAPHHVRSGYTNTETKEFIGNIWEVFAIKFEYFLLCEFFAEIGVCRIQEKLSVNMNEHQKYCKNAFIIFSCIFVKLYYFKSYSWIKILLCVNFFNRTLKTIIVRLNNFVLTPNKKGCSHRAGNRIDLKLKNKPRFKKKKQQWRAIQTRLNAPHWGQKHEQTRKKKKLWNSLWILTSQTSPDAVWLHGHLTVPSSLPCC